MRLNINIKTIRLCTILTVNLFFCFATSGQNEFQNFNVKKFPYTDVHMHASLKPFNSRSVAKYNLWEQIDHNCEGKMSFLFLSGSKEVPKTSQCHLEGLVRGNVKIAYLSLTPLEKEMMDPKLLNERKKGPQTMACISGTEFAELINKDKVVNYYDDFAENLKYIIEGENIPYTIDGKAYTYEIVKNAAHLEKLLADPFKIALILTIEGGHSLGKSLTPDDISQTTDYEKFYLANVDRIKGTLPFEGSSEKKLSYPVLSINLNHFFWNGLCGHARTFSTAQTFIFGAGKGVDEGMTELGKKVVNSLLDKTNGRRVLVDIKHMSLASREWYFQHLSELRAKGDTIPVFSSHSTVSGLSAKSKEYLKNDNKSKNKKSYLNQWTISLSNEDINEIFISKGLIGIMLEKYKLIGELGKKTIKKTIEGSSQRRKLYVKFIMANMFSCINAVKKPEAWNILSIGSDFDGLIVPFEIYPRANEMPDLAKDLYDFLKNPEPIFDLFSVDDIKKLMYDLSPEEILEKIMYKNGVEFAARNLN
jgi:microsomal dipeptidase-like Zn-dependent dipeptidase